MTMILACQCDVNGAKDQNCDEDGQCNCNEGYTGDRCDSCIDTYFKNDNLCERKYLYKW